MERTVLTRCCEGILTVVLLALLLAGIWQVGNARSIEQTLPPEPAFKNPQVADPTFYDEPDEYDLLKILADPDAYYSQSVPSRVWQQAPVDNEQLRWPEIQIIGQGMRFVEEHKPLAEPLVVLATPHRPVTFTALDQGTFANGKYSITVPADEHGYASAEFTVSSASGFRVLAGSPENHGPAEFVIEAYPADELKKLESGEYAEAYWEKFLPSPQAKAFLKQPPK